MYQKAAAVVYPSCIPEHKQVFQSLATCDGRLKRAFYLFLRQNQCVSGDKICWETFIWDMNELQILSTESRC